MRILSNIAEIDMSGLSDINKIAHHSSQVLGSTERPLRIAADFRFDESELDKMLKKTKVQTVAELDAELRRHGSSVKKQKDSPCKLRGVLF